MRRHRAKRRDDNEAAIIAALEAAGASVSQIDGDTGEPDLLIGFGGATYLQEVKRPTSSSGRTTGGASRPVNGGDGVSTRPQLEWRARWRGGPVAIVATPAEALTAIGAGAGAGAELLPELRQAAIAMGLGAPPPRSAPAHQIPPPRRRRSGMVTSDEAAAIRRAVDPDATCAAARHPRVVGTEKCPCGRAVNPASPVREGG